MRIKIINFALVIMFILFSFSLFNLQVIRGRTFKDLSDKNCIRLLPQPGARGKIKDRNQEIIVDNYLCYDVMILPENYIQLEKTLVTIAKILEVSPNDLKNNYTQNYVAPFMPVVIAKNIEVKKAIALEEIKIDSPDIIIQPHPLRYYPYGKLACHVIGYLSEIDRWRLTKLTDYGYKTKDIVGYSGVEEKYDYYLREEEGALSQEVDHRGKFVRILGYRPAQNGKDIELTIDLKIQKIVEDNLGDKIGSVIIMDPFSGEIIALASSPGFDPKIFIKKRDSTITRLFNDSDAALMNRAISGVYPPGSIFKPVVAAAALQEKKINLGTTFFCSGGIDIGKRRFNCWDTHNTQDLLAAITHSCDVFFYRTGLLLGAQAIHDYSLKFGLAKSTGIDLPYEVNGFVPDPLWKRIYRFQNWYDGDTANFAIGQGDLLVTPIQIARMMAVFANKGFLVRPYIVKALDGQSILDYQKKLFSLNLKLDTLDSIRQGLRRVVSDPGGTANVLSSLQVAVAGKTGTAQVSTGQPHAWFCGFFPFKNPKFVICVFLEHGGSGYRATLLTKKIIEEMIQEGLVK
jgi:penicillin-binding protein 2